MIYKPINYIWILLIVFLKIRHHNALNVNVTTSAAPITAKAPGVPEIAPRLFDYDGRNNPNIDEPRTFDNSPNNYQENPFLPYGNQNNYGQRPRPNYGWNPQNPNQVYYPGRPYQHSGYPGYQGYGPYTQGPDSYDPGFNPGYNPNYQRPGPYPNRPGYQTYPGNINRPYQNGGIPNQGSYQNRPTGYPDDLPQNGQYPRQGNFQRHPNQQPGGVASNYQPNNPNNINNIPDTNIQFPGNDISYPNQYPSTNGLVNQGNVDIRPNQNNINPTYPSNVPGNAYSSNNNNNIDSTIQFPGEDASNQIQGNNDVPGRSNLPVNVKHVPQSQLPSNQQPGLANDVNSNGPAAILGKPVYVPTVKLPPSQPISGGN